MIIEMLLSGFLFLFILVLNVVMGAFGYLMEKDDYNPDKDLKKINKNPKKFKIGICLALIEHGCVIALTILLFIAFSPYGLLIGIVLFILPCVMAGASFAVTSFSCTPAEVVINDVNKKLTRSNVTTLRYYDEIVNYLLINIYPIQYDSLKKTIYYWNQTDISINYNLAQKSTIFGDEYNLNRKIVFSRIKVGLYGIGLSSTLVG